MSRQNKLQNYTIWFLASIFYAYQYIIRVLPNILMPNIIENFHIDAGKFGQFSGIYYIGYAIVHIPIGILLDRFGPRYILPGCILLTSAGLAPLIYADYWIYPTIGRVLIGIGSSAAILGCFKIIRMAFPESRFTRMLGISVTIGLIGAIYGGQPVYFLMEAFGWKEVIGIMIAIGCALAAAIFICVPSDKEEKIAQKNIVQDIVSLVKNTKVISLCIFGGLMVAPLEGFADVWGTEFLKSVYNIEPGIAARLPSYIFLGMCFGASLLSYITEKTNAYYGVIALSAITMFAGFIYILTGQATQTTMGPIFVIIGILCAYQIPLIYKVSTFVKDHLSGMATGFANMIIMFFGYLYHSIIGQSMMFFWDGTTLEGHPFYSPSNYTQGLMVIPIGLAIASFGVFVVRFIDNKAKKYVVPN